MPEFSRPPQGPGAPNPKIPDTVPLAQADEQRQELYGPLAKMSKADVEKIDLDPEEGPEPEPQPEAESESTFVPPSEEDRKAFLSALLGGKQYEKKFTLFGGTTITLRDRTTKDTETVLAILRQRADKEAMTEEDYGIAYDRYMLVIQMVDLNGNEYAIKELNTDDQNVLDTSVRDWLLSMPRPIYHAVLMAFRRFEEENAFMTERALDSDFWTPVGSASAPRRTSAAPSTTKRTLATTRTGA
jgi:hypothetical protein